MLELTSAGQAIGLVSVGLTVASSLVRLAVLDKEKLREQRERIKHHQEQMKEAQKKKDLKGMQKHQQDMMAASMEQMRHSMKPMIFTMIPFLLVFSWMKGAYDPIGYIYNVSVSDRLPQGVEFSGLEHIGEKVDGRYAGEINSVVWNWSGLKSGGSGELKVALTAVDPGGVDVTSTPVGIEYTLPDGTSKRFEVAGGAAGGSLLQVNKTGVRVGGNKLSYSILYKNVGSDRVATLFGLDFGWFWWYFICAVVSSMIINKTLGIT